MSKSATCSVCGKELLAETRSYELGGETIDVPGWKHPGTQPHDWHGGDWDFVPQRNSLARLILSAARSLWSRFSELGNSLARRRGGPS